jgi:hypothetical protein
MMRHPEHNNGVHVLVNTIELIGLGLRTAGNVPRCLVPENIDSEFQVGIAKHKPSRRDGCERDWEESGRIDTGSYEQVIVHGLERVTGKADNP